MWTVCVYASHRRKTRKEKALCHAEWNVYARETFASSKRERRSFWCQIQINDKKERRVM